jgi:hypothetical protein
VTPKKRQAEREAQEAWKRSLREQAAKEREQAAQWEQSVQKDFGKKVAGLEESIRDWSRDYHSPLWRKIPPGASQNAMPGEFSLLLHTVKKEAPRLLTPEYVAGLWWVSKLTWMRPLALWEPEGKGRDSLFISLCKHLLAKYPVPQFVWSAFFADAETAAILTPVVAEVANGGSLFKLVQSGMFPVPLTRKTCHEVLQPHGGMSFVQAVRFVQTKTVDGSRRLFEAWMTTDPGKQIHSAADEAFWLTVLAFLAHNPMLEPGRIGPLVDFIRFRRGEEPEFSMKGRSVLALLRGMEEWHGQLRKKQLVGDATYKPSGFKGLEEKVKYRDESGAHRTSTWRVEELLSSKDLYGEGNTMHHCVWSYGKSIEVGLVSIWSMTLDDQKVLTVEVRNASQQVVQARGKLNRQANKSEFQTLTTWANKNRLLLKLGPW